MRKLLLSCNLNNVAVHLCCIQEMSKQNSSNIQSKNRRNIAKSDTPSRYINDRLLSGLTTDILRKTAGLSTFGKSKPPSLQN
jgi:hypothetical protein